MKISIIYWSGTGNTESMAELIAQGAKDAGAEVSLKNVSDASADDVTAADIAVLGCSSMGDEVLEEEEFEPFFQSVEGQLNGVKIALFGSYGWGDGQWMRDWEQRVRDAGADLLGDGLIVNETPEGEEADRCKELGKKLAG